METWRARAACRGMDPALFHQEGPASRAKSICTRCVVRSSCLAEGFRLDVIFDGLDANRAVYGGMTRSERDKVRSRTGGEGRRDECRQAG